MKRLIIITSLSAFAFVACKKSETTVVPAPATVNQPKDTSVSYAADIKPLTDAYCIACHKENHYITDMSKYDQLKARADNGLLNDRLFVKKDMPPAGNPKPNAAELQKIKDWISEGCKP